MRSSAPALAAALVLAFLAGGCSNDPYPPEGGKKILYAALSEDPRTLDPAQASDTLSGGVLANVYDSLYEYHYLKWHQLKPCLAVDMPEVSADRLTYTIRIKKGVVFQDDPCFPGGKGREVTADDFIYEIKRVADPGTRSTGWWLFQGKVVGLDEFHAEAAGRADAKGPMDYDLPVEGLAAPDPYTLRIRLKRPYPQLKYALAMSYTAAVPREAVRYYKDDFVNHPVGTGAFRLKEWTKRWRLILEKNPTYRDDFYPSEGGPGDAEAGLLDAAGERMPFLDEVYYSIISESQPAWLFFKQGYLGAAGLSKDNFNEAITPAKELTEEFRRKGVRLMRFAEADVYYIGFNMTDSILGPNRKLRQAMSLAFDTQWRIDNLYRGQAIPAQGPLPPGIFGYDPDFRNPYKTYDVPKARQLLAEAGYPGGIGSDGKRLTLTWDIGQPGPAAIQQAQAFQQDMKQIGIKVEVRTNTWNEFLNKAHEGRLQFFSLGWRLDYPDPENFLQLLYGPNSPPGPNNTRYDNPEYNELYKKMELMEDTPERLDIIHRMRDIVVEDAPWIPMVHSEPYLLYHQWVKNAKPQDITGGFLKYRDVDVALRGKLRREWNRPNYAAVAIVVGAFVLAGAFFALFRRGAPEREEQ